MTEPTAFDRADLYRLPSLRHAYRAGVAAAAANDGKPITELAEAVLSAALDRMYVVGLLPDPDAVARILKRLGREQGQAFIRAIRDALWTCSTFSVGEVHDALVAAGVPDPVKHGRVVAWALRRAAELHELHIDAEPITTVAFGGPLKIWDCPYQQCREACAALGLAGAEGAAG